MRLQIKNSEIIIANCFIYLKNDTVLVLKIKMSTYSFKP